MPTIHQLVRITSKFFIDNSPAILTGVAIAGTVSTSVLAVKATPQAMERIQKAEEKKYEALTEEEKLPGSSRLSAWETIKVTYPVYIPAAGVAVMTITCILGAHSINSKRTAALIGGLTLTETAFREYQEKVQTTIGESKERKIRDEIVQEKMRRTPPDYHNQMVVLNGTEQWCYDVPSGRYFKSDYETIRKAANDINHEALHNMWATQSQFYDLIGLRPNGMSDELGWASDKLLDVHFVSHLGDDGIPAIGINYFTIPVGSIHKYGGEPEYGGA